MSDLRDLYQEMIVEHSKSPRNFKKLEPHDLEGEGYNPLCGDEVKVFLKLDGDRVTDVSFLGSGCAISTASASMMTEVLKGKTKAEAEKLFQLFHKMVTTGELKDSDEAKLGKLAVFQGVCEFPTRVKCASLVWHTVHNAIEGKHAVAKTEEA